MPALSSPAHGSATAPLDLSARDTAEQVLAVFFRIATEWGLSPQEEQTLLGVGKTTLFAWRSGRVRSGLEPVVLERLSYLLRIYAALEILLPGPGRPKAWLRQPNTAPLFGGASALARLLGGQVGDLLVVAQYLDAQRGGDFA